MQFKDPLEVILSFPVEDKGKVTWPNERKKKKNNRLRQTKEPLKGLDIEKGRLFQEVYEHILWGGAEPIEKGGCGEKCM